MPRIHYERSAHAMMQSLLAELLREEESVARRANRDANRYDGVELGAPFHALATHCESTARAWRDCADTRGARRRRRASLLLRLASRARDLYRERFVTAERAYRSTIAKLRRGVDLVRLLRSAADVADDRELVELCDDWLEIRSAIVDAMSEQLAWFADRPRVSMESAHSIAFARARLAECRRMATQSAALPRRGRAPRRALPSFSYDGAAAPILQ